MPEDQPAAVETRAVDRLVFFSDAVVAIAITLLAIDLPVPVGHTPSQFWASVRDHDGQYVAFLISFAVIAASWYNHHDLFRYATKTDARLRTFNIAWLATIVLNPFATRMLTIRGGGSLDVRAYQFAFYSLLQVLSAACLFAMLQHLMSFQEARDTPRPVVATLAWQSYSVMLSFGLSIPLFFVTSDAWLLWIILPVTIGQVRRRLRLDRTATQ